MYDENAKKVVLFLEENGFVESKLGSFYKGLEKEIVILIRDLQASECRVSIIQSCSISDRLYAVRFMFKYDMELFLAICNSYRIFICESYVIDTMENYYAQYIYGAFDCFSNWTKKLKHINGELVFA